MGWVKPVTLWWSRFKPWGLSFLGFVGIVGIIILALMIFGPIFGDVFCHMADCLGDGVHINFVGREITEQYMIEVNFPSGKRTLICNLDQGSSTPDASLPDRDHCGPNGAFFEQLDKKQSDVPPEELIVTVVAHGERITQTIHPKYVIDYINGENCDPKCYYATIEFNFSQ